MSIVTSKDGTKIAYEKSGQGQPVILVDGAMCYRDSGPARPLADLLSKHFTVYIYDRRGRGESGDTKPYAVQREVEDIEAVINEAGGSAMVYGISSGAALALEAARAGLPITRLALYEAPFIVDDTHPPRPDDLTATFDALIAANRRSDAVKLFMKTVGVPGIFITIMRFTSGWKTMTGIAHTLPYDFRVLGDTGSGKPLPRDRWNSVTLPTLVMDGGKSPVYMRHGMQDVAAVLPNSEYRTIEGQTHMLKAEAVSPLLISFFGGEAAAVHENQQVGAAA